MISFSLEYYLYTNILIFKYIIILMFDGNDERAREPCINAHCTKPDTTVIGGHYTRLCVEHITTALI